MKHLLIFALAQLPIFTCPFSQILAQDKARDIVAVSPAWEDGFARGQHDAGRKVGWIGWGTAGFVGGIVAIGLIGTAVIVTILVAAGSTEESQ